MSPVSLLENPSGILGWCSQIEPSIYEFEVHLRFSSGLPGFFHAFSHWNLPFWGPSHTADIAGDTAFYTYDMLCLAREVMGQARLMASVGLDFGSSILNSFFFWGGGGVAVHWKNLIVN